MLNKKFLLIMMFVFVLAIPFCFASELSTTDNLDNAIHNAQSQNKKIIIVFDGKGCKYCDMFKEDVLKNENVINSLNDKYITVILDVDKNADIASKYKVFGTPTTVILDSNSKEIGRIEGYVDANEFLKELKDV